MVEVLSPAGQTRVAETTGLSRSTIIAATIYLAEGPVLGEGMCRPGAGLKRKTDRDRESRVGPESPGDPVRAMRWLLKPTRLLAPELTRLARKARANLVGDLLHYLGHSV